MFGDSAAILDGTSRYASWPAERRLRAQVTFTGLIFIRATDEDTAKTIMARDPCVLSRVVDVTRHSFDAGYVGAGPGYNHLRDEVKAAGDSD